MKSRLTFLQTLVPLLEQMSRSRDPHLAAEAAEEHAAKARELAKLRRSLAESHEAAAAAQPEAPESPAMPA